MYMFQNKSSSTASIFMCLDLGHKRCNMSQCNDLQYKSLVMK